MSCEYFIHRDQCPACRSKSFRNIYQQAYTTPLLSEYLESFYGSQGSVDFKYLKGADYHLCACKNCELIFQRQVPDDFLMEELYERWIDPKTAFLEHQRKDGIKKYTNYAKEIATVIAHFDAVPSTLKFLDFGMGWGIWALIAKAMGCDSYGSELSQERIAYASASGVKISSWDDIPNGKFNFINTEQVFEHISNPLDVMLHLKQGLNKNGVLKISVPTASNIDSRLGLMDWKANRKSKNSLNPVAPLEHINYFKRTSLLKMADIAGMVPVELARRNQYIFSPLTKTAGHFFKELFFPKKKNKNYMFFKIKA